MIYIFIARYCIYGTSATIPRFSELVGLFTGYNAQNVFNDYRDLSSIIINISNIFNNMIANQWQFHAVGEWDLLAFLDNISIGIQSIFNILLGISGVIVELVHLIGAFLGFLFTDILSVISVILNWLFAN